MKKNENWFKTVDMSWVRIKDGSLQADGYEVLVPALRQRVGQEGRSKMQSKKLTPLKAIRKHCLWCMREQSNEVKLCPESAKPCPLWKLRFGRGVKGVSALKQIRLRCFDCSGGSPQEIRNCKFSPEFGIGDVPWIRYCDLWVYRDGHNPSLKGKRGKGRKDAFNRQNKP